jgi:uncharacterized protein YjbI with pentapeptide repeats
LNNVGFEEGFYSAQSAPFWLIPGKLSRSPFTGFWATLISFGKSVFELPLDHVILVDVEAKGRQLAGIDLSEAELFEVDFSGADLRHAILKKAVLQNVNFQGAKLNNTKIGGIRIDEKTDMSKANWWQADFWIDDGTLADTGLLEQLYDRYSAAIPQGLDDVHISARAVIAIKRQGQKLG